ncbi:hypothetical protein BGZ96_012271 [Linnemannia gamsii]|uniref:HMG box domain-containing protein n=1 Tax=Linnemannia gamsii TaxID=64522 RepID=A0ABQ7JQQ2_9FUNG|nr:hypothetical protein BGZ96_012271 [Linnemannia gamsii]
MKQKRSQAEDDEEEITIDERLALLYLDPSPAPVPTPASTSSTSVSASIPAPTSTATPQPIPLQAKSHTTTATTSHISTAKASTKDCISTTTRPVNVISDDEPDQEVPPPYLIGYMMLQHYATKPGPTNDPISDPISDLQVRERYENKRRRLHTLYSSTSQSWESRNPGLKLPPDGCFSIKQQLEEGKRSKSQQAVDHARVKTAPYIQRAADRYKKEAADAYFLLTQQYRDAGLEYERGREVDRAKMNKHWAQSLQQCDISTREARAKMTQQHRALSQSYNQSPSQYQQGAHDLSEMAYFPSYLRESDWKHRFLLDDGGDDILEQRKEDKYNKAPEDHSRRKRVKRDDVKQELVDEEMTEPTTANTSSLSTTTTTFEAITSSPTADTTVTSPDYSATASLTSSNHTIF